MKRTLRPSIRTALEVITIFLTICLVSINDFELSALPIILLTFGIVVGNLYILRKY